LTAGERLDDEHQFKSQNSGEGKEDRRMMTLIWQLLPSWLCESKQ
jgi:hypothetical protein